MKPTIPLLVSLGLLNFAHAQNVIVGPEVVVTASRISQPVERALLPTTVITAADIARSQAYDLPSLLRLQPGLEFFQAGGAGHQSSLFLRGTESDHTLVLIDGVRINSVTAGTTALEHISLAQIERIEVVRGNVSSIYGSEAIGGVIQIFTKSAHVPSGASVGLGLGSYQTRRSDVQVRGGQANTRYGFDISWLDSGGFSSIKPEYVGRAEDLDRDGYRNLSFSADINHRFNAGSELGLRAWQSRSKVEFDGSFQNSSDQTLSSYLLTAAHPINEQWLTRLNASVGNDKLDSFLDNAQVSRFESQNQQIAWLNEMAFSPERRLTFGLEHLAQTVKSSSLYSQTRRNVVSATLGYLATHGLHSWQGNVRHDAYSDFGGANSVLLAYTYQLSPAWRASASVSNAFRAPNFNELYGPFGGNPNLNPEKALSGELGLQFQHESTLLKAQYFRSRITNLINFPAPQFTATNIDRANIQGLEFSYTTRILETDFKSNLTWQRARDQQTGLRLLRRADIYGSVSLAKSIGSWRWGAEALLSGTRDDIHVKNFNRVRLPGYAVINMTLDYQLNAAQRLGIRLENALDKDYELAHGYQTAGRSLFLNWRYQL